MPPDDVARGTFGWAPNVGLPAQDTPPLGPALRRPVHESSGSQVPGFAAVPGFSSLPPPVSLDAAESQTYSPGGSRASEEAK